MDNLIIFQILNLAESRLIYIYVILTFGVLWSVLRYEHMFLRGIMMAWEKGNPAFDAVSGSKVMGYAVNGINAAIGWTLSHLANELGEAGFGHLKIGDHTVNEIKIAQQEKHRKSMSVLEDFKTETNAPGLFKSVSNGSKKFSFDLEKDRPNIATPPSNEAKGVNSFKNSPNP